MYMDLKQEESKHVKITWLLEKDDKSETVKNQKFI